MIFILIPHFLCSETQTKSILAHRLTGKQWLLARPPCIYIIPILQICMFAKCTFYHIEFPWLTLICLNNHIINRESLWGKERWTERERGKNWTLHIWELTLKVSGKIQSQQRWQKQEHKRKLWSLIPTDTANSEYRITSS